MASRLSSVPLSGFGDNLLICGGRLPHAKKNSCYARCAFLSCWTRGEFDKHWIVSLCATQLWCARYPCQTLSWSSCSIPLRIQYIRLKKNFGQEIQCLSCHALSSASKLFPTFVLSHLRWNSQQCKLCWILVYIRGCNILPHSENTFAGNNPITFHFRGTFYCYLLFPCIQKPLI